MIMDAIAALHPFVCTFEGCNARFSKNSKLVYHIGKHTGERPFACQEENCNKSYTNPAHLRRHKLVTHGNYKCEKMVCPHNGCLKIFANKYSLKKHCNMKHNPNREYPFTCKECKKGFPKKRQLLQHSYIHTGVPPFKCETCELRFLTLADCNRHKRTHTVYMCECDEKFERWSLLLAHRKQCTVARPKCAICNKSFSNKTNLKVHLQLHKEDKEVYPCTYENCSRFYFQKKNLYYHVNTYHEKKHEGKISCTFPNCKQSFKTKQCLKNHLKNVHEKKKKKVKSRKPRKDKNIPKKSLAAKLAGLDLPRDVADSLNEIISEENKNPSDECDSVAIDRMNINDQTKDIDEIYHDNFVDYSKLNSRSLNFVKFIS